MLHTEHNAIQDELSMSQQQLKEWEHKFNTASKAAEELVQEKQLALDKSNTMQAENQKMLLDMKIDLQLQSVMCAEESKKMKELSESIEKNEEDKRALSDMCEELIAQLQHQKEENSYLKSPATKHSSIYTD